MQSRIFNFSAYVINSIKDDHGKYVAIQSMYGLQSGVKDASYGSEVKLKNINK